MGAGGGRVVETWVGGKQRRLLGASAAGWGGMLEVLVWWHGVYNQGKRCEAQNPVERELRRKAMGLLRYFEKKREQKEEESLRWLAEDFRELTKGQDKRSGVDSSSSNSKGNLKPSMPIYREVVLKPGTKSCPDCGSHYIRPAGYKDRSECQDCGNVFS